MVMPDVTVIVGVYNSRDYIEQCLESVMAQSLDADQIQLIVVDDGSTDGTSDVLVKLAAHHERLRVISQGNSGNPAGPRNTALEHAQGRFVFFLDSDDYLAEEALERMVAMADDNETDVVIGKYASVDGRKVPRSMFTHDQPRTDVFSSRAYWTLNPLKLFRRSLIEEHHLRFPASLPVGQDQPFVAQAYLHAHAISILASYDCYHYRLREDGGNNTEHPESAQRWLRIFEHMIPLAKSFTDEGAKQNLLLRRHFQSEQRDFLRHLLKVPANQRAELFAKFREIVRDWASHDVCEPLPAEDRLRLELTRRGQLDLLMQVTETCLAKDVELHFEKGHAFALLPGFRSQSPGIPDAYYDVTSELKPKHTLTDSQWENEKYLIDGHIVTPGVSPENVAVTLVLRRRDNGKELVLKTHSSCIPSNPDHQSQGENKSLTYRALIDVSLLTSSLTSRQRIWDCFVRTQFYGLTTERRIGQSRSGHIELTPTYIKSNLLTRLRNRNRTVSRTEVKPYLTNPFENLSFKLSDSANIARPTLPRQRAKKQAKAAST